MLTNACTGIIVSYKYKPESVTCIVGKFGEIYRIRNLVSIYKRAGYRQISFNHLVDSSLNLSNFGNSGLSIEQIVALTLLPLNMAVSGARASVHPYHGLVEDMLCRMHWRILCLVVLVKLFGHDFLINTTKIVINGDKKRGENSPLSVNNLFCRTLIGELRNFVGFIFVLLDSLFNYLNSLDKLLVYPFELLVRIVG